MGVFINLSSLAEKRFQPLSRALSHLTPNPPNPTRCHPGCSGGSRCLWQPYFASSGPCGGGFQSPRQQSRAVSPAAAGERRLAPAEPAAALLAKTAPDGAGKCTGSVFPLPKRARSLGRKNRPGLLGIADRVYVGFVFSFFPKRKRPPCPPEQKQTAPKARSRGRGGRADN